MKLNLGCGANVIDGFTNVDKYPHLFLIDPAKGPPDFMLCDLEATSYDGERYQPWIWKTSSVDEIHFIHSLEHMGQKPEGFRHIITEVYRIAQHNAKIFIAVPHPRHDDYLNDPTHVRPITPQLLELFSRKKNAEWAEKRYSNSQLAFAWGVDFELVEANGILDPDVEKQNLPREQIVDLVRGLNNVVKEFQITLRVVKEKVH